MKVFVLGAPCSGKSKLAASIALPGVVVIDVDVEIVRLNGGTWPDIDTKNERYLPLVLESAATQSNVVMFNSYMPLDRTRWLRAHGFDVVLLDVPAAELRRRDRLRWAAEGWTNIEWFDWNQSVIQEHVDAGLVDQVIDGDRPADEVREELTGLFGHP